MSNSGIFYRMLEPALQSLSDSTDRMISLPGETITFLGLNSTYAAHQHVKVQSGHHISGLAVIANKSHWLAISRFPSKFDGDCLVGDVPACYLRELFQFPAMMPKYLLAERDVFSHWEVAIPCHLKGFDNDGNPDFGKNAMVVYDCAFGKETPIYGANTIGPLRYLTPEDCSPAVDMAEWGT